MPIPTNKINFKKKNNAKADSFLEAFRDLGSDFYPSPKNDLYQAEYDLKRKYESQLRRAEIVRRQEQILFTQKEKETQQQVKILQEEIKKLAKATGDLAKEAEISSMEVTPSVGTYHVNFFERLIKAIKVLRQQVQESSFWLASWNKKAQKKNHYWGQFKKSGSKFLLSADRYMSTQAG